MSTRKRILIFDTLCEYTSGVICQDLHELAKIWRHLSVANKDFKIIYQPLNFTADFPIICELVFDHGDMTFCVEEIDTFLSRNPEGLDAAFLNIVQRGRHRGIELIGITQRPFAVPPILRSQCKRLITFRQFEDRDITWLSGILGDRALEVPDLKQFEYLEMDNDTIEKKRTEKPTNAGDDMRPLREQVQGEVEDLPETENQTPETPRSGLDEIFF